MADNKRILIIDDDQSIWKSYESVLNRGGNQPSAREELAALLRDDSAIETTVSYPLSFAQQGKQGLQMVHQALQQEQPYALAFIDVRMPPGWDGVKTATQIRQADPDIEIVIVTAYADISRADMVEEIGHPDKLLYLRKPFDAEELSQIALQLTSKWQLAQTQRHQQEHIQSLLNKLSQTHDYLNNIINSMQSMLIGISEKMEVTHWNSAAESLTGISYERALGQKIHELLPLNPQLEELIHSAISSNTQQRLHKLALDLPQQSNRLYEVCVFPLEQEDSRTAVIRIDDITERSRVEEIMVQSDKMLTVGGLAAGMAHEINTPLGSIMQSAQVIAKRLDMDNPKNQQVARHYGLDMEKCHQYMQERGIYQLLESIRESGGRTSRIVKSMLSFSHQGRTTCTSQVNDLIDEALELAKSDYDLKKYYGFPDFEITRNYADDLPTIQIDKTKLEQVILNLIKNAAQSMSEMPAEHQPHISITTSSNEQNVCIQIKDNGPGIDEETQKRIFDPFFTTKEIGKGTGLGLSLVYFIVSRQHNGVIEVESEKGAGACFNIQLPIHPNGATEENGTANTRSME